MFYIVCSFDFQERKIFTTLICLDVFFGYYSLVLCVLFLDCSCGLCLLFCRPFPLLTLCLVPSSFGTFKNTVRCFWFKSKKKSFLASFEIENLFINTFYFLIPSFLFLFLIYYFYYFFHLICVDCFVGRALGCSVISIRRT